MSLVVVGSLALDSVQTPYGERKDVLGGSCSYLSVSASFWAQVRACGVIGRDFPDEHLQRFVRRGIDVEGIVRTEGKSFRWHGRYGYDLNEAQTLQTQLNVFATFRPELSQRARAEAFVMLGNFGPEAQSHAIAQLAAPRLVACDTMNYWISGHTRELKRTLAQVGLLCINEAEVKQLTGQQHVLAAAQAARSLGPRWVVVKRGEHGVLLVGPDEQFALPAFALPEVADPTGAGDTFAGGMMGYLAREQGIGSEQIRQAVLVGSCMASFAVQDFSLDRLLSLSKEEIQDRLDAYQRMVRLPESMPRLA